MKWVRYIVCFVALMLTVASYGAVGCGSLSCATPSGSQLLCSSDNDIPQWEDIGLEDLLVVVTVTGVPAPVVVAGRMPSDAGWAQVAVAGVKTVARRMSVKRLFADRAIDVYLYGHCQLRL